MLRQIIGVYNALAQAEDAGALRALTRRLYGLLFGWRGHLYLLTARPDDIARLLLELPARLGLEPQSKAADGDGWGEVYAHLAATFGWGYDEIDRRMTLSRLKEMQGYLRRHPPTHLLVAAYLQYEPPTTAAERKRRFFERFLGA